MKDKRKAIYYNFFEMQSKTEMQQTTNTCVLQFLLFVYNRYNISNILSV